MPATATRREVAHELTAEGLCIGCGFSHRPAKRRERLRTALPATQTQLLERYACVYAAAPWKLLRDLKAIGAAQEPGRRPAGIDREWRLP